MDPKTSCDSCRPDSLRQGKVVNESPEPFTPDAPREMLDRARINPLQLMPALTCAYLTESTSLR